jgi:hypothetical protein
VILLVALVLGLLGGWGWARWRGRAYRAPTLKSVWLVAAAFLPQLVFAYWPAARHLLPARAGAFVLPLTLTVFLAFVWINRRAAGMPVLLVGLALNLLVIAANGGWMPISLETAAHLPGGENLTPADLGRRFGQKDVLLQPAETRLEWLSDRYLLPDWVRYRVAFSAGDIFVGAGAFLVMLGLPTQTTFERSET